MAVLLICCITALTQSNLYTHKAPTTELMRRSAAFSNKILCVSSQAPIMVLDAYRALVFSQIRNLRPEITDYYFTFWRVYNSRASLPVSIRWGVSVLL